MPSKYIPFHRNCFHAYAIRGPRVFKLDSLCRFFILWSLFQTNDSIPEFTTPLVHFMSFKTRLCKISVSLQETWTDCNFVLNTRSNKPIYKSRWYPKDIWKASSQNLKEKLNVAVTVTWPFNFHEFLTFQHRHCSKLAKQIEHLSV